MEPLWGIDLGGTKIEGVIIKNIQPLEIITRIRIPTERDKGYQHILHQIALLVEQMKQQSGLLPRSIGIGAPGTINPPSQLLKNSNTIVLNGKPLLADLQTLLQTPIVMANDANCFAVAETLLGVVPQQIPDAMVVFGVIMGTGVGGGLVINGKARNGLHGIAGEWGHNFLDDSGGPCYCGLSGCIEMIISGPALEQYYFTISKKQRKLQEILQRADQLKEPAALQTKERLLHFFGKALASVINILDPDAIILGGGLGNIPALYDEGLQSVIQHSFNSEINTPLLKPMLGDSAGVFGAALLQVPEF